MTAGSHLQEIFVRAPRHRVWHALTDPESTARFLEGAAFEHGGAAGPFRLVGPDGETAVDGEIESFEPAHRLTMTWRVVGDDELRDEPPGRVEWTLTPAVDDGSITRVTLRHVELGLSPATWARYEVGWVAVLGSLKSLLETGEAMPTEAIARGQSVDDDPEAHWHRAQAVTANNAVWELLDGRELRPDEIDELLQRAYAAAYHWKRARGATVVNRLRASYLVSRAHAFCGQGALALHHADRCIELVGEIPDDAADFDHAYAYEARARALACLGRFPEASEARRRATAVVIADEQDRSIFRSDLADGPWFGLPT